MDFILNSYVSSYLDVDLEYFVSMDLRFGDSRMLRFCFEQVFDNWNKFNNNKEMKFWNKVQNDDHVSGPGFGV